MEAEYDTERAGEKAKELLELALEAVVKHWQSADHEASPAEALEVATEVLSNFLTQIIPPITVDLGHVYLGEEPDTSFEMITMRQGGRSGAYTVKPGNMLLDFRKLVTAVASSALTVVGAVAVPWTAPLAAIVILDSLWINLKVELSEREAATIWTMWQNRDDDNCVSDTALLDMVNAELEKHGRSPISREQLDDSLERLQKIRCIERSKSDPSNWWLQEKVRVEYP